MAYSAADVIVSRAGAMAISELPLLKTRFAGSVCGRRSSNQKRSDFEVEKKRC